MCFREKWGVYCRAKNAKRVPLETSRADIFIKDTQQNVFSPTVFHSIINKDLKGNNKNYYLDELPEQVFADLL